MDQQYNMHCLRSIKYWKEQQMHAFITTATHFQQSAGHPFLGQSEVVHVFKTVVEHEASGSWNKQKVICVRFEWSVQHKLTWRILKSAVATIVIKMSSDQLNQCLLQVMLLPKGFVSSSSSDNASLMNWAQYLPCTCFPLAIINDCFPSLSEKVKPYQLMGVSFDSSLY